MSRQIALRSLKDLCAFIGAIALFSYFFNWAADLRHWYFTLASALFCFILWLGFYVIETRGGVKHVVSQVAAELSRLRTKAELPSPSVEGAEPVSTDPPSAAEPAAASPPAAKRNPLPWLKSHRTSEGDRTEKEPLPSGD